MFQSNYFGQSLLRLLKRYSLSTISSKYSRRLEFEKKLKAFYKDLESFKNSMKNSSLSGYSQITHITPLLEDKTPTTGFDAHYIYHPAWASRILKRNQPEYHIDISSTLHFCSIVSAFIPVHFYDYRPANLILSGLKSSRADLLNLPFSSNSIQSISCMHTVEHVGLGRYGDPIDFEGDVKAMKELARVLAPGGTLLFVVPVGYPRIEFNAHRIYNYDQVMNNFTDLKLVEFTLIGDNYLDEGMIVNPDKHKVDKQDWGCGCFHFTKE